MPDGRVITNYTITLTFRRAADVVNTNNQLQAGSSVSEATRIDAPTSEVTEEVPSLVTQEPAGVVHTLPIRNITTTENPIAPEMSQPDPEIQAAIELPPVAPATPGRRKLPTRIRPIMDTSKDDDVEGLDFGTNDNPFNPPAKQGNKRCK